MTKRKKTNDRKNNIEAKKAAVLGNPKKSRLPIIIAVLAVCLIAGGVGAYVGIVKPTSGPATATATAPQPVQPTQVSFPLSQFDDGRAQHFDYKAGNITVRYFILKSSDGIVRAAFDACDVCWPAGKGYYQDGDSMVCRNCGRRFHSVLINEIKGGCNPAPLTRSVEGDQLVIKVDEILKGKPYFNFSGKA